MLTEFVLIFFNKPDARKTLNRSLPLLICELCLLHWKGAVIVRKAQPTDKAVKLLIRNRAEHEAD